LFLQFLNHQKRVWGLAGSPTATQLTDGGGRMIWSCNGTLCIVSTWYKNRTGLEVGEADQRDVCASCTCHTTYILFAHLCVSRRSQVGVSVMIIHCPRCCTSWWRASRHAGEFDARHLPRCKLVSCTAKPSCSKSTGHLILQCVFPPFIFCFWAHFDQSKVGTFLLWIPGLRSVPASLTVTAGPSGK
jgi:hypothetical protein